VGEMSAVFHSDLSALIAEHDIDVWTFGHTHANLYYIVDGTQYVISNQAGYPDENVRDFNAGMLIEP
jgi:hypothetical protein